MFRINGMTKGFKSFTSISNKIFACVIFKQLKDETSLSQLDDWLKYNKNCAKNFRQSECEIEMAKWCNQYDLISLFPSF